MRRLLLATFFLSGCVIHDASIPQIQVDAGRLEQFQGRVNYDILGPVEGQATTYSILFGLVMFGDGGFELGFPFVSLLLMQDRQWSYQLALDAALAGKPDADMVLAPREQATRTNFLLFSTTRSTVKGKAVRLQAGAR